MTKKRHFKSFAFHLFKIGALPIASQFFPGIKAPASLRKTAFEGYTLSCLLSSQTEKWGKMLVYLC
jgi:hypothetical protein